MKKGKGLFKIMAALLCLCLLLTSCAPAEQEEADVSGNSQQVQNLEKLCLVWGYTKYRHPAFYTGEKDWDEELAQLIPQMQEAKTDKEANQILTDWFVSLGKIENSENYHQQQWEDRDPKTMLLCELDWAKDSEYLGQELVEHLQQIEVVPSMRGTKQYPAEVDAYHAQITFNEDTDSNFDYRDSTDRLMGLFRAWNAMEYYFPYKNLMDENWHELLSESIAQMLQGDDQHSYEQVMLSLVAASRDTHVFFQNISSFFTIEVGQYSVPVELTSLEGSPVVNRVMEENCLLEVGDVIVALDDQPIEDVVMERQKYLANTTDDKLRVRICPFLLFSHNQQMEITVLRNGVEQTVSVMGQTPSQRAKYDSTTAEQFIQPAYQILEGNIGLINPEVLLEEQVDEAMAELASMDGLVIDMRQYPDYQAVWKLMGYISGSETKPALNFGVPVSYYPGAYQYIQMNVQPSAAGNPFLQKPIVVLIDQTSWSLSEFAVMFYRTNDNVTIVGENSIGSDGDRVLITMPDGNVLSFTGFSVYGPNMEQTQRVGLTPDIEVHPTVEGIKEGRDELMEAAVAYIQEQNQSSDAAPVQDNSEAPLGSPENPIAEEPQDNDEAPLGSPENPIAREPISEEPQDNDEAPLGSPENPIAREPIAEEPQTE